MQEVKNQIQSQAELLALICMNVLPKNDPGFLFLLLNSLKSCIQKEVILSDIL